MANSRASAVNGTAVRGWTVVRPLGARAVPTLAAQADLAAGGSELVVLQTFRREAEREADPIRDLRALSALRHQNVARIKDVVENGDEIAVVTQLVEGETLAALRKAAEAKGTRIPIGVELRILVDVLAGLAAIHALKDSKLKALGIVHGELAPANVVVGPDGMARVVQLCGVHAAPGAQGADTIPHLAPEILLADDAFDQRVDVYGAGVMLWEALNGSPLFTETNAGAIVTRHLSGRIRKATVPGDSSWAEPLVDVAQKAIATDPAVRYPNVNELASEIKRIAKSNLAATARVAQMVKELGGEAIAKRRAAFGLPADAPAAAPKAPIASVAKPAAAAAPAKIAPSTSIAASAAKTAASAAEPAKPAEPIADAEPTANAEPIARATASFSKPAIARATASFSKPAVLSADAGAKPAATPRDKPAVALSRSGTIPFGPPANAPKSTANPPARPAKPPPGKRPAFELDSGDLVSDDPESSAVERTARLPHDVPITEASTDGAHDRVTSPGGEIEPAGFDVDFEAPAARPVVGMAAAPRVATPPEPAPRVEPAPRIATPPEPAPRVATPPARVPTPQAHDAPPLAAPPIAIGASHESTEAAAHDSLASGSTRAATPASSEASQTPASPFAFAPLPDASSVDAPSEAAVDDSSKRKKRAAVVAFALVSLVVVTVVVAALRSGSKTPADEAATKPTTTAVEKKPEPAIAATPDPTPSDPTPPTPTPPTSTPPAATTADKPVATAAPPATTAEAPAVPPPVAAPPPATGAAKGDPPSNKPKTKPKTYDPLGI